MKKILVTLFLLFSFDALAQNDTPQEMIKKFVQIIGDQIIDVAKDKSLSEFQKKQKIINIIDKSTDSKWIARFVLGKNHKTANEEQKKQFMSMYREFMINTYGPKFNSYDGKKFAVNSVEKQSNFYLCPYFLYIMLCYINTYLHKINFYFYSTLYYFLVVANLFALSAAAFAAPAK